jgi:16S rRNA A1518/A1519 N6-dimethyltransferase RsmA/KsgA/DIM1 with predicted DNA glycosylase/AP lyase activity
LRSTDAGFAINATPHATRADRRDMSEPWNINIHYDGKLDASVPREAQSVLDVGCGDGFLAARLSRRVARVVAIDIDNPVLGRAKKRFPDAQVEWRQGDILAEYQGSAVLANALGQPPAHGTPSPTPLRLLERMSPFNLIISNVPGAAVDLYLCGQDSTAGRSSP